MSANSFNAVAAPSHSCSENEEDDEGEEEEEQYKEDEEFTENGLMDDELVLFEVTAEAAVAKGAVFAIDAPSFSSRDEAKGDKVSRTSGKRLGSERNSSLVTWLAAVLVAIKRW